MNTFKEEILQEEAVVDQQPKEQPKRQKSKILLAAEAKLNFEKGEVGKALPFIFFLTFLAVIYIFNSNITIRTIRESDMVAKEIKEHRAEYISVKSEFMFKSKQSQVAKALRESNTGLNELTEPPMKITFNPEEDEY